jgi:hypothetical protein
MEESQKLVNSLVGRKRKDQAGGFNYVCALDGFSCEGRKAAVAHLREKYPEKVAELGEQQPLSCPHKRIHQEHKHS